jgi:hypothetical protein
MNPLRTLLLAWIEARAAANTYASYRKMSDLELLDLGLERRGLAQAAMAAAERRSAAAEAALEPQTRPELFGATYGAMR